MADCGELVSEVEEEEQALEPVFDPSLVHTVDGTCRIEPREGTPNEVRTFAVDVENPNAQAALATVSWALVDVDNQPAIARTGVEPIEPEDTVTAVASVAPTDVDIVPDAFSSRVRAIVVPGSVEEVFVGPRMTGERVRAGNDDHHPVADGGRAKPEFHRAVARACSGCAERSRKMTAANRRIRDRFDIFENSQ